MELILQQEWSYSLCKAFGAKREPDADADADADHPARIAAALDRCIENEKVVLERDLGVQQ
jgi:hypothetical protein